jgi:hypothetical protein
VEAAGLGRAEVSVGWAACSVATDRSRNPPRICPALSSRTPRICPAPLCMQLLSVFRGLRPAAPLLPIVPIRKPLQRYAELSPNAPLIRITKTWRCNHTTPAPEYQPPRSINLFGKWRKQIAVESQMRRARKAASLLPKRGRTQKNAWESVTRSRSTRHGRAIAVQRTASLPLAYPGHPRLGHDKDVDGRIKSGHDEGEGGAPVVLEPSPSPRVMAGP